MRGRRLGLERGRKTFRLDGGIRTISRERLHVSYGGHMSFGLAHGERET